MKQCVTRREFLERTIGLAAGARLGLSLGIGGFLNPSEGAEASARRSDAKVSIVRCLTYGQQEVNSAFSKVLDLLGGIKGLVSGKTVTVKLNLTGTDFTPFLDRPVGETFMTHCATALALAGELFRNGAKCVRFVESTQSTASLQSTLALADWDIKSLASLGRVEFENTRNLGLGSRYSRIKVPGSAYMFSAFDLNHAYEDTDVMISMAKLKNHVTAGVTLSMKNMFGLTPNSLYGSQAGDEEATEGRMPLHNPIGHEKVRLPGLKEGITSTESTWRVPRITADLCAARPVHLAIIDGITAMKGGEGPWCGGEGKLKFTAPGLLIAGLNPVSTDAVGAAVMGYTNPRAPKGIKPFGECDNHLLLADEAGTGTADLSKIDVRGLSIQKALYPYG
jgi:uncharacterized protein (DUF362 family)